MKTKISAIIIFLLVSSMSLSAQEFQLKVNAINGPKNFNIALYFFKNGAVNTDSINKAEIKIINGIGWLKGKINGPSEMVQLTYKQKFHTIVDTGLNTIDLVFDSNNNIVFKPKSRSEQFLEKYFKLATNLFRNNDTSNTDAIFKHCIDFKNDYFSLIAFNFLSNMPNTEDFIEKQLHFFDLYSDSLKSTKLGIEIYKRLRQEDKSQKNVKIGNHVPYFTVKTFEGTTFSNKDLKNVPYIIALSATWCIPCQKLQPILLNLYHKYRDQGLKVVYFNLDDKKDIWAKHIKEKKLDWINVSEGSKFQDSEIAKSFNTYAIPRYFIVDKNGIMSYDSDKDDFKGLETAIQKASE